MPDFKMYRVFCSTSAMLEDERRIFHDHTGAVNENGGMESGILFIPVTLRSETAPKHEATQVKSLSPAVEITCRLRAVISWLISIQPDLSCGEYRFDKQHYPTYNPAYA